MTWHLKDCELEEKLIEIFPNFVQILNEEKKKISCFEVEVTIPLKNDDFSFGGIWFPLSQLKENEEYNPDDWNRFPQVTPPNNVLMRLEVFRVTPHSQKTYHNAAIFSGGRWRYGKNYIEIKDGDDVRFRPWE